MLQPSYTPGQWQSLPHSPPMCTAEQRRCTRILFGGFAAHDSRPTGRLAGWRLRAPETTAARPPANMRTLRINIGRASACVRACGPGQGMRVPQLLSDRRRCRFGSGTTTPQASLYSGTEEIISVLILDGNKYYAKIRNKY